MHIEIKLKNADEAQKHKSKFKMEEGAVEYFKGKRELVMSIRGMKPEKKQRRN